MIFFHFFPDIYKRAKQLLNRIQLEYSSDSVSLEVVEKALDIENKKNEKTIGVQKFNDKLNENNFQISARHFNIFESTKATFRRPLHYTPNVQNNRKFSTANDFVTKKEVN